MTVNEKVSSGMTPSTPAEIPGSTSPACTHATQFSVACAWCWLLVALSTAAAAGHMFQIVGQRLGVPPDRLERADYIVDVNSAPQHELEALPNVGTALASRIVQYRQAQGPFDQLEDLQLVRGVGTRTLEQLRPRLSLSSSASPPE